MLRGLQNRCGGLNSSRMGSIPIPSVSLPHAHRPIAGARAVIFDAHARGAPGLVVSLWRAKMDDYREYLRSIPKVDEVMKIKKLADLAEQGSRTEAVETVRSLTEKLRHQILRAAADTGTNGQKRGDSRAFCIPPAEELAEQAAALLEKQPGTHLRRVINATGVVLHTNLGRAVLPETAVRAAAEAAGFSSNLEYDLDNGTRGSRHAHVEEILKKITGAEAAMAVNNNAAAVLLCLSALAAGKEVIVSRGEEVEIGGAFRVPDIMRQSGAILKEIGTTNRTKPEDYRDAVTENTGALLKVHKSNYRIVGFTRETTLQELKEIGQETGLPVLYDMGSGLFTDLGRFGIDEPVVSAALKAGADLVMFSGDKLLGGPQAGFAVGKKELIDRMKKHPLARAVRVDKMTIAAAEAVLRLYLDPEKAMREIPALRQITAGEDSLRARAEAFVKSLESSAGTKGWRFAAEPCEDKPGGGSAPAAVLKGYAVTVCPEEESSGSGNTPEQLEMALRQAALPVICRIAEGKLWLSFRTVRPEEEDRLLESLLEATARQ